MKRIYGASLLLLTTALSVGFGSAARADSLQSYCEYVEADQAEAAVSMPCVFSQRQGTVGISWEDGVYSQFIPYEGGPGQYLDRRGGLVYRQFEQRGADLSFQMEQGTIHVYWGVR